MPDFFDDKIILITGGSGTFGTQATKVLLEEHNPQQIRIFSRSELLQQEMRFKFNSNPKLLFILGDVREIESLRRAMYKVDIVFHAAAIKQIGACELNPIEAVLTNVNGAINVARASIENEVWKVMGISSDKSSWPVNLYGATKFVMEKLLIQSNVYVGTRKTRLSCVRYGNVAGSRGSVVPVFQEQKKHGVITLTDDRMTRFWFTVDQAVRFTIKCIETMQGGEIFVPTIPSIKITDLADAIAPEAKRQYIGIRPSEKLHEVLLTEEEARHSKRLDNYFRIEPERGAFHASDHWDDGEPLPEGFTYTSKNNNVWLNQEDLGKTIEDLRENL